MTRIVKAGDQTLKTWKRTLHFFRKRVSTSAPWTISRDEEIPLLPVLHKKGISVPSPDELLHRTRTFLHSCGHPHQVRVTQNHLISTVRLGFKLNAYSFEQSQELVEHINRLSTTLMESLSRQTVGS